jgi:hypothetical protein
VWDDEVDEHELGGAPPFALGDHDEREDDH